MFVNDVFVVGGGGVCLSLFFAYLRFLPSDLGCFIVQIKVLRSATYHLGLLCLPNFWSFFLVYKGLNELRFSCVNNHRLR